MTTFLRGFVFGSAIGLAAVSMPTDAPPPHYVSSLTVQRQGESARVVARWTAACDPRGCSDSYRVRWTVNGTEKTTRTMQRLADTAWFPLPLLGDSIRVAVEVTPLRRAMMGPTRTASRLVRGVDQPPPAVDSLTIDTLAYRDSFPESPMIRTTTGKRGVAVQGGARVQFCALTGKNRYTGKVRILTNSTWSLAAREAVVRDCEPTRAAIEHGAPD